VTIRTAFESGRWPLAGVPMGEAARNSSVALVPRITYLLMISFSLPPETDKALADIDGRRMVPAKNPLHIGKQLGKKRNRLVDLSGQIQKIGIKASAVECVRMVWTQDPPLVSEQLGKQLDRLLDLPGPAQPEGDVAPGAKRVGMVRPQDPFPCQ
jgi:hypothetical protein